jgi:hypothetical protein
MAFYGKVVREKVRGIVRSAPIRIAVEGVTMRGWRQKNSIRVRSRCCRMRRTSGGQSEMSAQPSTAADPDGGPLRPWDLMRNVLPLAD